MRATEEAVTLANRKDPSDPIGPAAQADPMPGLQDVAEQALDGLRYPRDWSVSGKRKGKIVVEIRLGRRPAAHRRTDELRQAATVAKVADFALHARDQRHGRITSP